MTSEQMNAVRYAARLLDLSGGELGPPAGLVAVRDPDRVEDFIFDNPGQNLTPDEVAALWDFIGTYYRPTLEARLRTIMDAFALSPERL